MMLQLILRAPQNIKFHSTDFAKFKISLATTAGFSQVIKKPSHFINGTYSFINLSFSFNMSFKINYGIVQSIFEKCHSNIIYRTLDVNVLLLPLYYREILDYKNVDTESI